MERAVVRAGAWALSWSGASLVVLTTPGASQQPLLLAIIHLTTVVALGLALAFVVVAEISDPWFLGVGPFWRWLRTGIGAVALVTGFVALVTLTSAAALRFEPSMQFLQLLSALDIAWVTAATGLGVYWLAGRLPAISAALALAVVCIWSSWRYLDRVGFSLDGGWKVDGEALLKLVIPLEVMAAMIAVTLLIAGAHRNAQADPQPDGQ